MIYLERRPKNQLYNALAYTTISILQAAMYYSCHPLKAGKFKIVNNFDKGQDIEPRHESAANNISHGQNVHSALRHSVAMLSRII